MNGWFFIMVPPPGIEPGFLPSQGSVLSIERREHYSARSLKETLT